MPGLLKENKASEQQNCDSTNKLWDRIYIHLAGSIGNTELNVVPRLSSLVTVADMDKQLNFFFDREGDILYLSVGKSRPGLPEEVGDNTIVRFDPKSHRVVGCKFLNFTKRFGHMKKAESLPLAAELLLRR